MLESANGAPKKAKPERTVKEYPHGYLAYLKDFCSAKVVRGYTTKKSVPDLLDLIAATITDEKVLTPEEYINQKPSRNKK